MISGLKGRRDFRSQDAALGVDRGPDQALSLGVVSLPMQHPAHLGHGLQGFRIVDAQCFAADPAQHAPSKREHERTARGFRRSWP